NGSSVGTGAYRPPLARGRRRLERKCWSAGGRRPGLAEERPRPPGAVAVLAGVWGEGFTGSDGRGSLPRHSRLVVRFANDGEVSYSWPVRWAQGWARPGGPAPSPTTRPSGLGRTSTETASDSGWTAPRTGPAAGAGLPGRQSHWAWAPCAG